ncbi:MAG: RNA polymerase sigma factor [Myxococcaceae bacterium]|nr:RNA polymerase sigma factor [Myxococcaceae bacterium]
MRERVINLGCSLQMPKEDVGHSQPRSALLEACREGDQRAWRRLFDEHAAQVYRWAVFMGLPPAEAADASQEVLYTCVRRLHTCPNDEAFMPWLYQIVRRVVANARRNRWLANFFRPESALEQAFEHTEATDRDNELCVRRCLSGLSDAQRQVLVLSDIEGYTREELARMLEVPPGTVASRLRLAREAFKRAWQAQEPHRPVEAAGLSWGKP